jgi:uncharacterized membrane protein
MYGNIRGQVKNIHFGCHGIPERCLTFRGKKMNICARCFGTNIGHIIAFVLFIASLLPPWYWAIVCIGIMFVDWSLQTFFKIMSNNTRRVITGTIGGFGMGCLIWIGIAKIINLLVPMFR